MTIPVYGSSPPDLLGGEGLTDDAAAYPTSSGAMAHPEPPPMSWAPHDNVSEGKSLRTTDAHQQDPFYATSVLEIDQGDVEDGINPHADPMEEIVQDHHRSYSTRRYLTMAVIIILAVIAIVLGVLLATNNNSNSNSSSTSGPENGDGAAGPAPAPKAAVTYTISNAPATTTLQGVVEGRSDLSTLVKALNAANLSDNLSNNSQGPFTVFAPNNDAFAQINASYLGRLLQEEGWFLHLQDLLLFHITVPNLAAADLTDQEVVRMVNQESITFEVSGNSIGLDSAFDSTTYVTEANLAATNGYIHMVNRVMRPAFLSFDLYQGIRTDPDNFSVMAALINVAGLQDQVQTGTYTFFVPIDARFSTFLIDYFNTLATADQVESLVLYHLVPGVYPSLLLKTGSLPTEQGGALQVSVDNLGNVTVNQAAVVALNALSVNGVAHAVDALLIPPGILPISVTLAQEANLSLFFRLLTNRLLTALTGTGAYTVFAPTNAAFSALDQTYLTKLLSTGWAYHMIGILYHHLINSTYTTSDLSDGLVITMLNYENITVQNALGDGNNISLVDATNQTSDLIDGSQYLCSNGVVYNIDRVLKPEFFSYNLFQSLAASEDFSIMANLTVAAGLNTILATVDLTLLIPTNEAFSRVNSTLLQSLRNNVTKLAQVLRYHMIPDVYPTLVLTDGNLTTLEGSDLMVNISTASLSFNNVSVTQVNGLASNGIAHVLDGVLIPPDVQL